MFLVSDLPVSSLCPSIFSLSCLFSISLTREYAQVFGKVDALWTIPEHYAVYFEDPDRMKVVTASRRIIFSSS